MLKKIVSVIMATVCVIMCLTTVSWAKSDFAQELPEVEETSQIQGLKNGGFSVPNIIDRFRQKLTAIVRIGDTTIAEVGAERDEADRTFSTYIEILGYPLQQIIDFFANLKEYF